MCTMIALPPALEINEIERLMPYVGPVWTKRKTNMNLKVENA